MRKKFANTLIYSAITGLFLSSCGAFAASSENQSMQVGKYKIVFFDDSEVAKIVDDKNIDVVGPFNTSTGMITTVNKNEVQSALDSFLQAHPEAGNNKDAVTQIIGETFRYSIDEPSLRIGNIENLTVSDIENIKGYVDLVSNNITSKTANAYNAAIQNGMSPDSAFAATQNGSAALLNELNRLGTNVNKLNNDTFNLDKKTTVGINADGSLTSAEGAKKTITVNDGLIALSGRTDRINATVGNIDRRVTENTQAINSHSHQLQEHNTRLNSQQRQIRENHQEMKRAAAQSAALAGLFQPYSVGKFNATAALGGYSDKQAVAVGVGYRFNEQAAAKAGIAASDGDVSYNIGMNVEF